MERQKKDVAVVREMPVKEKKRKSEMGMVYLITAGLSTWATFYLIAGSYGNPYYFSFFQLSITAFIIVPIIIVAEALNDDVSVIPRWLNPAMRQQLVKEKVIKGAKRGFLLIGMESVPLLAIIKLWNIQPFYEKIPPGPHRDYVMQQYLHPHQPAAMEFALLMIGATTLVVTTIVFGWWAIARFITFYKYNEKRGMLEIKKIPVFFFFLPLLLFVAAIINSAIVGFYHSVKTKYPTFPDLLQPLIPFADAIFIGWICLLALLSTVLYHDGVHALRTRRFVTPEFESEVKLVMDDGRQPW